jgi:hypothetical protein
MTLTTLKIIYRGLTLRYTRALQAENLLIEVDVEITRICNFYHLILQHSFLPLHQVNPLDIRVRAIIYIHPLKTTMHKS